MYVTYRAGPAHTLHFWLEVTNEQAATAPPVVREFSKLAEIHVIKTEELGWILAFKPG